MSSSSEDEDIFISSQTLHVCQFPFCGMKFNRPSRLKAHACVHTGIKPFLCSICSKSYGRAAHLKRHKMKEHPIPYDGNEVSCDLCAKKFANNFYLQNHVKISHRIKKQYICTECAPESVGFVKKFQLTLHMIKVHSKFTKYQCKDCGKSLPTKSKLNDHSSIHVKTCSICSEVFDKWTKLRKHMAINHPKLSFQCPQCPKKFRSQKSLENHKQCHEKNFSCPDCDRTYGLKKNLDAHLKTAHGGVFFVCPKCDRSFSTKQKLSNHCDKKICSLTQKPKKATKVNRKLTRKVKDPIDSAPSIASLLSNYYGNAEQTVKFPDPNEILLELNGQDLAEPQDETLDTAVLCPRKHSIFQNSNSILNYIEQAYQEN